MRHVSFMSFVRRSIAAKFMLLTSRKPETLYLAQFNGHHYGWRYTTGKT